MAATAYGVRSTPSRRDSRAWGSASPHAYGLAGATAHAVSDKALSGATRRFSTSSVHLGSSWGRRSSTPDYDDGWTASRASRFWPLWPSSDAFQPRYFYHSGRIRRRLGYSHWLPPRPLSGLEQVRLSGRDGVSVGPERCACPITTADGMVLSAFSVSPAWTTFARLWSSPVFEPGFGAYLFGSRLPGH